MLYIKRLYMIWLYNTSQSRRIYRSSTTLWQFLILQTQTAHVSLRSAPLLADFKQPSYSCPKLLRAYIDAVFPRVFDYLPHNRRTVTEAYKVNALWLSGIPYLPGVYVKEYVLIFNGKRNMVSSVVVCFFVRLTTLVRSWFDEITGQTCHVLCFDAAASVMSRHDDCWVDGCVSGGMEKAEVIVASLCGVFVGNGGCECSWILVTIVTTHNAQATSSNLVSLSGSEPWSNSAPS